MKPDKIKVPPCPSVSQTRLWTAIPGAVSGLDTRPKAVSGRWEQGTGHFGDRAPRGQSTPRTGNRIPRGRGTSGRGHTGVGAHRRQSTPVPGAAGDGTPQLPPGFPHRRPSEQPRGIPASPAGAERVSRLPILSPGEGGHSPPALPLPRQPARLTPSRSSEGPRAAGHHRPSLHKAVPSRRSRGVGLVSRSRGPAPPPAPTAVRPARSPLPSGRLLGNALFRPTRSQSQRGSGPPGPPPTPSPNQSAAGAGREGGTAAMAGWGASPAPGRALRGRQETALFAEQASPQRAELRGLGTAPRCYSPASSAMTWAPPPGTNVPPERIHVPQPKRN